MTTATIQEKRRNQSKQQHLSSKTDLDEPQPLQDAADYLKAYARERPEVAALWCFGIGFVLGWKLKPW